MATALTHLGYDLWTLQTEPMNERGEHLEDKKELGLSLDYGLQVATDTPVVGQHRENTLVPSDWCYLSQENTRHTHYVCSVCVCSYIHTYIRTYTARGRISQQLDIPCAVVSGVTHDMLPYLTNDMSEVTHDMLLYLTNDMSIVTHDMLPYLVDDMSGVTHDMLPYLMDDMSGVTHDMLPYLMDDMSGVTHDMTCRLCML